jgi:hypothetical protein
MELSAVTVFYDSLVLIAWNSKSGLVLQSSLDGKSASPIIEFDGKDLSGVTADAKHIYVTHSQRHYISKIPWRTVWSPQTHKKFHIQTRKLIKSVVVASLCSISSQPKCQLKKLPKEILFHILSFLD